MPEPLRPLLESEKAALQAALPDDLKPVLDKIFTVKETCWNCEHFSIRQKDHSYCSVHEKTVPSDKRNQKYECFEIRQPEPF